MEGEMRALARLGGLLFLAILLCPSIGGAAEPGVTDSEIVVGMWAAMTGPVAHLGTSTRDGFLTVINEVNAAGGVHGRKIRLIAYDDAGSPQEALTAVRRLIFQDRVFALVIGSTSGATLPVIPLINQSKVPFVSGTSSNVRLLQPHSRYVFRPYPNDTWQAYRLIDFIVEKGGSKRPAILYVSDDYGKGGHELVSQRLEEKHRLKLAAAEQYNKGDQDFSAQLLRIRQANPDSVLIWAFAPDAAIVVRQARELGITVQLYGSASTATPLFPRGAGQVGVGFMANYPLPYLPESTTVPAVGKYRAAVEKLYPSGLPAGRPSLYDFLGVGAARILVEGLQRAGRDVTREKLVDALETLKEFDPGLILPVTYTKDNHEGSTEVRMLRVNDKVQWEVIPH
jgi:branched-chain amino acid transport system substrate-binding protein